MSHFSTVETDSTGRSLLDHFLETLQELSDAMLSLYRTVHCLNQQSPRQRETEAHLRTSEAEAPIGDPDLLAGRSHRHAGFAGGRATRTSHARRERERADKPARHAARRRRGSLLDSVAGARVRVAAIAAVTPRPSPPRGRQRPARPGTCRSLPVRGRKPPRDWLRPRPSSSEEYLRRVAARESIGSWKSRYSSRRYSRYSTTL